MRMSQLPLTLLTAVGCAALHRAGRLQARLPRGPAEAVREGHLRLCARRGPAGAHVGAGHVPRMAHTLEGRAGALIACGAMPGLEPCSCLDACMCGACFCKCLLLCAVRCVHHQISKPCSCLMGLYDLARQHAASARGAHASHSWQWSARPAGLSSICYLQEGMAALGNITRYEFRDLNAPPDFRKANEEVDDRRRAQRRRNKPLCWLRPSCSSLAASI